MVFLFEIITTAARNCAPINSANASVDSIESIMHPLTNRKDGQNRSVSEWGSFDPADLLLVG